MHDLDRIEYVCREIDRGIVSHDYIKTLLAYARRALRVERGMEKHRILLSHSDDYYCACIEETMECGLGIEPFAAVLALLDKLEPQTEGSNSDGR